jgi:hypothetical protein
VVEKNVVHVVEKSLKITAMDDLVLNIADDGFQNHTRPVHTNKGGKWTDR